MTPPELHLRLNQAAAELKALRAAENQRRIKAGPQMPRDHDRSARWLGGNLNPTTPNPKETQP